MINYICDACGKTAPAPTAEWDLRHCPPLGWFTRRGVALAASGKYTVFVIVCGEKCCSAYDMAEVEQVGMHWNKTVITTDDSSFKGLFPINPTKVKRVRSTRSTRGSHE